MTVTGNRVDNLSFARIVFVRFSKMNFLIQKSTYSLICAHQPEKKHTYSEIDDKWSSCCDWGEQWTNQQKCTHKIHGKHLKSRREPTNVTQWNASTGIEIRHKIPLRMAIKSTSCQSIIDRCIQYNVKTVCFSLLFSLPSSSSFFKTLWIATFMWPEIFGFIDLCETCEMD